MIRRFNYTDRIRILRKDIRITIREEQGKFAFDADLAALGDYEIPPESLVFVEAYRQANWMRFNFGRVGAIIPAKNRDLSQFDLPEGLLFRVKVTQNTDTHILLAEADEIPLVRADQDQGERMPLLPVKSEKLGDEIYRVDFDRRPILLINSEAGNYANIGRSPAFVSLVYPSVFRDILNRVLLVERHDDDADPNDWKSQWVKFASYHPGLGDLPDTKDTEGRCDWIDAAVSVFAKQLKARAKFSEFWKEGA